jgi:hypothetical protein
MLIRQIRLLPLRQATHARVAVEGWHPRFAMRDGLPGPRCDLFELVGQRRGGFCVFVAHDVLPERQTAVGARRGCENMSDDVMLKRGI